MNWQIDFDAHNGIVMVKASGHVTIGAFLEYLKAGLADPRWRKGTPILLDFRGLDTDEVVYDQVEEIASVFSPYSSAIGNVAAAVVVSRPQQYGLVRVWEVLARKLLSAHDVFYTLDEALEFLKKSADAGNGDSDEIPQ